MKTGTLKSFLDVHTWTGLIAGFGLFIAFYAGSLTVFRDPIEQWEHGPGGQARPADTVVAQRLVDAGLARFPDMAPGFHLSFDAGGTPTLGWKGTPSPADGATERHLRLDAAGQAVEYKAPSELADFVYRLHYTAGLPRAWGEYVLGAICVLYGLALVSGVVLFLPTLARDLFALRVGPNLKRLWQDAHNAIGALSLPFHAIFAWSGALLTLGALVLVPFDTLVFDQKLKTILAPEQTLAPPVAASHRPAPMQPVARLVAIAQRHDPGLGVTYMGFTHYRDANAQVSVYGLLEGQKILVPFGAVALRAADGAVRAVQGPGPGQMSAGGTFQRALIALHYGNYGGAGLRWAYFGLGLAGAFLFYSGNLLWIERRRKRRQLSQPRRTRVMAQATLGVCLGCIGGVSALFLASKLLPVDLPERAAWAARGYYAVFLGSLAWAFARPPSRAAAELLWLCAGLTAAVPLAGWGVDGVVSMALGGGAMLALHMVCLGLALAYARFALAAARRARYGDPHSVWAHPPTATVATPPPSVTPTPGPRLA